MTSFIDLRGASGDVYRYRLAQTNTLPATAGNFVYVAPPLEAGRVVCCGATRNLAKAAEAAADAVKQHGATHLYVRLNVMSRARRREHDDLVSALQPPLVVSDPD